MIHHHFKHGLFITWDQRLRLESIVTSPLDYLQVVQRIGNTKAEPNGSEMGPLFRMTRQSFNFEREHEGGDDEEHPLDFGLHIVLSGNPN